MGKKGKALYIGLFLDEPSQVRVICAIQRHVGEIHVNKYAHHLTLAFKPTPKEVKALPIGTEVTLHAVGYGADEKAQVILCSLAYAPASLYCANTHPHITVATADGVSPVYSNKLLANGFEMLPRPIELKARVGYFDGRNDRFDFQGTIYEE